MIEYIKGKLRWVRPGNLLAVLALFFSSLLFFYDLLKGRYLLTERDLGPYFIPPRFFWVESVKKGEFPLWNPYQFSGHPFFANPQHAILYPLNGLFFLLPFDIAFNAIIILHFFLGGLFTYLFLRDLKAGSTGSLISGLIFMLSGYLLSVHSLLNCLLSVIWTPLTMMFFRRAIIHPGFKNEILTAVFITFSFLGGGLEIVYGNFIILLFMLIFSRQLNPPHPPLAKGGEEGSRHRSIPIDWGRIKGLFSRFRSLLIVSIIFLLLSAIQFIPFLELWIHSIRGKGISYEEATIWSFAPKDVLLFLLPDGYGYFLDMKKYWVTQCWLKTLYTGGLPFVLSLIFFLAPHPELSQTGEMAFGKYRKLFLSLMVFSLFLSLGHYNPLYPVVFRYVPFFNGIRYPVKFLYVFILVLSMTAGLGFQRLTEFSKESGNQTLRNLFILFSLLSGLMLLGLVLGHQEIEPFLKSKAIDFPDFQYVSVNLYNAKRFLFYLTLFFLLLRIGHEVKWRGWVKGLLVFFLIADLFGNMGFYGREKTPDYFRKTRILEIISYDADRFRVFSTAKTISQDVPILVGHATYIDYLKEKHLPTMNLLYRLHDAWGIDVVHLKRTEDLYRALIGTPSISSTNLMDLYGVKYVISVTPIEEDPRFELIYARLEGLQGEKEDLLKENTIKLYKNKNPLPRAWLVKNFRVSDSKEILSKINTREFHPDREVLLEEDPLWLTPNSELRTPNSLAGLAEILFESNNKLKLRVRAAENLFLVLSDTFFPGWKACVNGKEEKIYRANYAFRAIPLTAGSHEVELIYDPLSFWTGVIITFLAIISLVGIGWVQRRRGISLKLFQYPRSPSLKIDFSTASGDLRDKRYEAFCDYSSL